MKAITVLCLVFFLALSQAVVNNHFAQKRAEVSQSGLTSPLVFTIDSTEVAIGNVSCTNSSTGRNAIRITIDVDNSVVLTKFAVYFNTPGATRYITQEQYGYVENNATNGYSFSQCGLHTNRYRYTVNYTSLVEVIGSECYEVDVALSFKKFNGSYAPLSAVSQSLPGCDIEYQVYSPAPNSYLQIVFGANQTVDGYCLNAGLTIVANTPYKGQILSSYDPVVLGSAPGEYVGNPQNFDLVNYIFNNIERYTSARFANVTGERCGWQDIQYAIWSLLDNVAPIENLTVPISSSCVSTIIADARANGEGYVPSCPGGTYVVFLVPIDRECQLNCTRRNGTQITGFAQGGPCLSQCELRYNYYNSSASGNFCIGAECAAPVFASVSSSASSSSSVSASVVVAASPSSTAAAVFPSVSSSASSSSSASASSSAPVVVSASSSSSASSSASASASLSPINFPQIPTRSSSPSQGPQDK